MLSLDQEIEKNPHQRIRRTRDFRIDDSKSGSVQYAFEKPERAEKLNEHTERIRKCLKISMTA
jgi:hypothetical protein